MCRFLTVAGPKNNDSHNNGSYKKVIAQGIETEEQLALFSELNIDGYQGYLVEKPHLMTSKM